MQTKVVFLLDKTSTPDIPHIYAVFPDIPDNKTGSLLVCYSHVGQHSSVHRDYIRKSKLAPPGQYLALQKELEGLGYDLIIQTSMP